MAFTPHPNDDASADAPLLLAVTDLTTDSNAGVTAVRMFDFVTVSPWTTFGITCGVTLVTALPVVELKVVAFVKNIPVAKLPLKTGAVSSWTWGAGGPVLGATNCTGPLWG